MEPLYISSYPLDTPPPSHCTTLSKRHVAWGVGPTLCSPPRGCSSGLYSRGYRNLPVQPAALFVGTPSQLTVILVGHCLPNPLFSLLFFVHLFGARSQALLDQPFKYCPRCPNNREVSYLPLGTRLCIELCIMRSGVRT